MTEHNFSKEQLTAMRLLPSDAVTQVNTLDYVIRETDPPLTPVRHIAEFEPMDGVLIRYPFGISTAIIKEMAEDVIVYTLVSSSQQNSAYNSMNNAGVDMDNVEFILGSTDSYWTRDYGPWWVVDGNRDVSVVDFTYNRPRENDNEAPLKMSNYLNTPYFATDIVTAGGNYMTDGYGISASTTLIYEENSMSDNQIHQDMLDYYGVHAYHTIEDPNNEYIDHIDCWGKFLSPEKLLLRSVPASHAQYDEIEAAVDYFENMTNGHGEAYEIFRVYTPNNQPYTNSLILNNKVLVPIMNSSWDDDALAVYEEAMPGYEVIGFTDTWDSQWEPTDALHCRIKGIPDLEMLQIFHNPIDDYIVNSINSYVVVEATIDDLSDQGLINEELKVFWKNDSMDAYLEINMQDCPQNIMDCYNAEIPAQNSDTEIQYYIQAADNSGREEQLPMAGYYSFNTIGRLLGDVNIDNSINISDVLMVVDIIIGATEPSEQQAILANVNEDAGINVLDIISIVGMIVENDLAAQAAEDDDLYMI